MRVYRVGEGGRTLELLHKTPVDGVPGAMAAFRGRLVVGVNNVLRLYDLGEPCRTAPCARQSSSHC